MIEHPELHAFRPNVGIILLNAEGLVWLGRRMPPKSGKQDPNHAWQLPQGGMDPGETPEETAARELYEETGVKSTRLLAMTPGWLAYEFPAAYVARKKEKWRGQRQKWAVMLFEGDDGEVDLQAHEEQEFAEWAWVPWDEMANRVVPFKLALYQELLESFRPLSEFIRQSA